MLEAARIDYGAPGALGLIRFGATTWRGASGTADRDGATITPSTRFRIASITKPIVAALVLDAVGRGDLSLDDVVGDILPGVVRADPPITVRMLLDHTSGVFDEGNEGDPIADIARLTDADLRAEAEDLAARYADGERVIASDRLLVALAETHERYFPPGTGSHYSNINYQLAAMVLERATGRPIAGLLRTRIVEPLGLERTTIAPPDLGSPEMRGYRPSPTDGSLVDMTDDLVAFGNGGNGGIVSTADELAAMLDGIVSGRLIPPALVDEMRRPATASGGTYGLGLALYDLPCGTFYGHGGAVNGTGSIAMVDGTGERSVVVAMNLLTDIDAGLPDLAARLVCPT
jgi:D-alanyl-D-alanine carboxypeptidase